MQSLEAEPIVNLERVSNVRVSFSESFDLSDVLNGKIALFAGGIIGLLREAQTESLNPYILIAAAMVLATGLSLQFKMPTMEDKKPSI